MQFLEAGWRSLSPVGIFKWAVTSLIIELCCFASHERFFSCGFLVAVVVDSLRVHLQIAGHHVVGHSSALFVVMAQEKMKQAARQMNQVSLVQKVLQHAFFIAAI